MDRAKQALAGAGLCEVLNFGFAKRTWLQSLGFEPQISVLNPLSEECEVMVPSLVPGLIRNCLENWNHHFGSDLPALRLFELRPTFGLKSGSTHPEAQGQLETQVEEKWKLALALSGPRFAQALKVEQGAIDFQDVRGVLESLFERLGTRGVRFTPLNSPTSALAKILHPGQSADVWVGKELAGHVGLLHPRAAQQIKTRDSLWLGELDWEIISRLSRSALDVPRHRPWPAFPTMERDFALLVGHSVNADKIAQLAYLSRFTGIRGDDKRCSPGYLF
jgi:phenylalanyl-tRNA synthetase beta chain